MSDRSKRSSPPGFRTSRGSSPQASICLHPGAEACFKRGPSNNKDALHQRLRLGVHGRPIHDSSGDRLWQHRVPQPWKDLQWCSSPPPPRTLTLAPPSRLVSTPRNQILPSSSKRGGNGDSLCSPLLAAATASDACPCSLDDTHKRRSLGCSPALHAGCSIRPAGELNRRTVHAPSS